ncbi:tellurite resistance TerB family protein [Sorangium sp. So ce131]|uniref:tellurite resistance TerB family protein n=1 Tax=Sorangium sp. So ce131 TaxID=3133282 RepID=UPI003F64486A
MSAPIDRRPGGVAPGASRPGGVVPGASRPGADSPRARVASILAQAARAYSARPPIEDITMPTGFDPAAVALFETIIEAAFLVANADGEFDAAERKRFQSIVVDACQNLVHEKQIEALLADLGEMLAEDGTEKRVSMVARTIARTEHQREVLRVAAYMAHASGGVSAPERAVLEQLARGFKLDAAAVDEALTQAAEPVEV